MLFPVEPSPFDLVCPLCGTPLRRVHEKDPQSVLYCPGPSGLNQTEVRYPITYQTYLGRVAIENPSP